MIIFYFLVFTLPFYFHPLFNMHLGPTTLVKLVGFGSLVYAGIHILLRGSLPDLIGHRLSKLYLALTGLVFLSVTFSGVREGWVSTAAVQIFVSILILFIVTLSVLDSVNRIRWALLVCLAACALSSLYVLREFQLGASIYSSYRPGYVVGDPNYFSISALLVLPIAWFWFRSESIWYFRWAALGTLVVGGVAFLLAASRGGMLGAVAVVLFLVWRSRRRFRTALVSVALFVPLLAVIPSSPLQRFLVPSTGDQVGVDTRLQAWRGGYEMVRQHPLGGVGLGMFKPLVGQYSGNPGFAQMAHNTYLELAAELGIGASLLFLWLLWEAHRSLTNLQKLAWKTKQMFLHNLALGMNAGVAGYAVGSIFLSAQYHKLFWFYIFLIVVLVQLARKHAAAGPTEVRPA